MAWPSFPTALHQSDRGWCQKCPHPITHKHTCFPALYSWPCSHSTSSVSFVFCFVLFCPPTPSPKEATLRVWWCFRQRKSYEVNLQTEGHALNMKERMRRYRLGMVAEWSGRDCSHCQMLRMGLAWKHLILSTCVFALLDSRTTNNM